MDNNRNDMNSEPDWLNNEIGLLTQEALQRGSCLATVSVFIPQNHDYSFEFHPIKTALRPQGTTAILRVYDLHFRIYGNMFEDPQIKCNIKTLNYPSGSTKRK